MCDTLLGDQIFEVLKAHLKANGMDIKQGTIIDATLIAAPSYTLTETAGRAWRRHKKFCKVNVLAALTNLFMARH